MEKLTGNNYNSLMEAYAAVYDQDLRKRLEEEKQAKEELFDNFVEFIDALIEEGYDLTDCKYDDLCDIYVSCLQETCVLEEGLGKAAGAFLKKEAGRIITKYGPKVLESGKGLLKGGLKQGKEAVKTVLSPVGHVWKGTLGTKSPLRNPWGAATLGTAAAGAALINKGSIKVPSLPTVKITPSTSTPSETPAERATRQRNELQVVSGGGSGYVSKMKPSDSRYKESQALADRLSAQQLRQQQRRPAPAPAPSTPQLEVTPEGQIKLK